MNKKNLHLEVSLQGDSYQLSHRERETLAFTSTLEPLHFRIALGSLEPPRELRPCLKVHYGKGQNTGAQIFNRRDAKSYIGRVSI